MKREQLSADSRLSCSTVLADHEQSEGGGAEDTFKKTLRMQDRKRAAGNGHPQDSSNETVKTNIEKQRDKNRTTIRRPSKSSDINL